VCDQVFKHTIQTAHTSGMR